MADQSWAMKGELVLSCNCTVFCPCVLSLGNHPPTEGYCQTWAGFRIDNGHFGDVDLSGIDANAGVAGNDTFTLESGQATTAPGQIVVTHETREDGEYTVISGDTSGSNAPEFRISIAGNHTLTGTDFNL